MKKKAFYIATALIAVVVLLCALMFINYINYQKAAANFEEIEMPEDVDSFVWHDETEVYTFNDSTRAALKRKGYKVIDDYYDDDGSHITWFKKND